MFKTKWPSIVMFGFYVLASGAIWDHHGPLVKKHDIEKKEIFLYWWNFTVKSGNYRVITVTQPFGRELTLHHTIPTFNDTEK